MNQTKLPLIGRDRQLHELQALYTLAKEGNGGIVIVKALSGVGKTRLLQEFEEQIAAVSNVFWGTAVDKSAMEPFGIFQNVVSKTSEVVKNNNSLFNRIQENLSGWQDSISAIFPQFREIIVSEDKKISADSGTQTRAIRALQHFIDSLGSKNNPAVIILDDCQWADEISVLMLYEWANKHEFAVRNILIVLAYRSNEVDPHSRLGRISALASVELGNLDHAEIILMLESISGSVEQKISQLVVRLSGGNPFLVSAVFQGLKEIGSIKNDDGEWKLLENENDTISYQVETKHLLQRRIELLSAVHQELLRYGAVLGKVIDIYVLKDLLSIPIQDLYVLLDDLEKRHILSAREGESISFAHDKIREAVFAMCTQKDLQKINFTIAQYLESKKPDAIYQIAFHYDNSANLEKASSFAAQASAEALNRQALALAEGYYQIALKGLKTLALEVRREVLSGFGSVLMGRAKYSQCIGVLEQAQVLTDDPIQKAEIDRTLGMAYGFQSNTNKAIDAFLNGLKTLSAPFPRNQFTLALGLLNELLQYLYMLIVPQFLLRKKSIQESKREIAVARLYIRLAYPFFFESRLLEMSYLAFRGKNITDRIESTPEKAFFTSGFQQMFLSVQWFRPALHYGKAGLAIAKQSTDEWVLGTCYELYGLTLLFTGNLNEALENLLKGTKLFEHLGYRWDENITRCNVAYAFYYLGNLPEAILECKRTLAGTREIKDFQSLTPALFTWARSTMGDVPEEILFEFYEEVECADMQSRTQLRAAISLWHMRHERFDQAEKLLLETRDLVAKHPLKTEYIFSCMIWIPTVIRKDIESKGTHEYFESRKSDWLKQIKAAEKVSAKYCLMRAQVLREKAYFYLWLQDQEKVKICLEQSLENATIYGQRYEIPQTYAATSEAAKLFGWEDCGRFRELAINGYKDCGADLQYLAKTL